MNEDQIKQKATEYARSIKKSFVKEFTEHYQKDEVPVSVFMAGSPGAGKTESSKRLLEDIQKDTEEQKIMRIDPDEFRMQFVSCGYTGSNSHLFHSAVSILADAVHDVALESKQSFIFDGTFSNIEKARENITRSLRRKRFIQIFYVYQEPIQAWKFVQEREKLEGRKIRKDDFIQKYFAAREAVDTIKREFGKDIQVDILIKNTDGTDKIYKENVDLVDNYISEKYSKGTLEELIEIYV